jgi:hypothetical protein
MRDGLRNLQETHLKNKCGGRNLTILKTHLIPFYTSLVSPFPRAPNSSKMTHSYKMTTPKREMRYHYDYCNKDGHLVMFFLGRKRDDREDFEVTS